MFFRGSAEKGLAKDEDQPKINSYAASKDLEQLSKADTSEEIIKSIGLGMNGYIPFFSSFPR
jgi:hypothetical protein